jgi:hypothetical protein
LEEFGSLCVCVKPGSCRQRDAPQDHSFACGMHVS